MRNTKYNIDVSIYIHVLNNVYTVEENVTMLAQTHRWCSHCRATSFKQYSKLKYKISFDPYNNLLECLDVSCVTGCQGM